jgi:hypothetical protein
MPQIALTKWTTQQLVVDIATATSIFRIERIGEPKQKYDAFFDKFETIFAELIDELPKIFADPLDLKLFSRLVKGKDRKKSFRYLGAPPISEDDLKTLAEASYGPLVFKRDPAAAARVRDLIRAVLDTHRFPWIDAGRNPTDEERAGAIAASAAMAAARDVETSRRNNSKQVQEQAVKDLLKTLGMNEVPAREILSLSSGAAPAPGEFCGESRVAGTRADVVARLRNGDIMLIECKVSNSAVNSYKRVVHDTGGKAAHWYGALGKASTIPCAVLGGVFARQNLEQIQNADVSLFWQHRLQDLADYVNNIP